MAWAYAIDARAVYARLGPRRRRQDAKLTRMGAHVCRRILAVLVVEARLDPVGMVAFPAVTAVQHFKRARLRAAKIDLQAADVIAPLHERRLVHELVVRPDPEDDAAAFRRIVNAHVRLDAKRSLAQRNHDTGRSMRTKPQPTPLTAYGQGATRNRTIHAHRPPAARGVRDVHHLDRLLMFGEKSPGGQGRNADDNHPSHASAP